MSGAPATLRRISSVAAEPAARLLRTLRVGRPPSQRPLPRVRIALGPRLPGAVLRLVVPLVALGCVSLLQPGTFTSVLAVVGAVLLAVRPSGVAAGCYVVGLGLLLALAPADPFSLIPHLLLFGVHLLVQLGAIASVVPWSAVVDARVLVSPARRFLVAQVFAQLLAVLAAALSSTSLTLAALPVLAVAGLTLLAWWLVSLLARGPGDPPVQSIRSE